VTGRGAEDAAIAVGAKARRFQPHLDAAVLVPTRLVFVAGYWKRQAISARVEHSKGRELSSARAFDA
jgi:hypothetical protein